MKLESMKCPNCLHSLNISEDDSFVTCEYCGESFRISDDIQKIEFINTFKTIDIAKITKEEAKKEVALERLKIEERENTRKQKESVRFERALIGAIIAMMIRLLALCGMTALESRHDKKMKEQGYINAANVSDYLSKNYTGVVEQFKAMGFSNIETIDLDDAGIFSNKKDTIENATIDGNKFSDKDYFTGSEKVLISYH